MEMNLADTQQHALNQEQVNRCRGLFQRIIGNLVELVLKNEREPRPFFSVSPRDLTQIDEIAKSWLTNYDNFRYINRWTMSNIRLRSQCSNVLNCNLEQMWRQSFGANCPKTTVVVRIHADGVCELTSQEDRIALEQSFEQVSQRYGEYGDNIQCLKETKDNCFYVIVFFNCPEEARSSCVNFTLSKREIVKKKADELIQTYQTDNNLIQLTEGMQHVRQELCEIGEIVASSAEKIGGIDIKIDVLHETTKDIWEMVKSIHKNQNGTNTNWLWTKKS